MSKRAYSLAFIVVGIGMIAAARTPSDQWIERMGCFLVAFSFLSFLSDLKDRRDKKQS